MNGVNSPRAAGSLQAFRMFTVTKSESGKRKMKYFREEIKRVQRVGTWELRRRCLVVRCGAVR